MMSGVSILLTILVVLAALALSAWAGLALVQFVLDRAMPTGASAADGADEPTPADVLRGGTWIGVLERLATTAAILLGYPAAVAVVVAVKGLGRYPELHGSRGVSERFIIGTLTSLLWAGAIGAGGRALLTLV